MTPDGNAIRILFSGRLEDRKGLDCLAALAAAIEQAGGADLHIASNNTRNAERFAGLARTRIESGLQLEDMRAYYNSGDALYFPSKYEGFSMSTLEALACGIPVVGTGFAVPEELRAYPFCRIIAEDAPPEAALEALREMAFAWRGRRDEIHAQIARDFGRAQYEEKLLAVMGPISRDKTIVVVSLEGFTNSGGVERVCYYLREILQQRARVVTLEKLPLSFGKVPTHLQKKINSLLQPIVASLRLAAMNNKVVLSNSWQTFLYPVDFSFHHGTTKGYADRIPGANTIASRCTALMEKISTRTARRLLAVSRNCASELANLYGADKNRIHVLNNFVDERIFYPERQTFAP